MLFSYERRNTENNLFTWSLDTSGLQEGFDERQKRAGRELGDGSDAAGDTDHSAKLIEKILPQFSRGFN
jgi:hypothetical protein